MPGEQGREQGFGAAGPTVGRAAGPAAGPTAGPASEHVESWPEPAHGAPRPGGDAAAGPDGAAPGGVDSGAGGTGVGPAAPPGTARPRAVEPGSDWFGSGPTGGSGTGAGGRGAGGPRPDGPTADEPEAERESEREERQGTGRAAAQGAGVPPRIGASQRSFAERYPAHIPLPPTAPRPAPVRGAFRPVTIRTARDAVAAAAGYLRWLGFRDVVQPEERPASGVDLRAPGLVAQVDPSTRQTSLRAVECLWLNGLSASAVSVFFSLAGYTPEARSRAAEIGLPLFVLDLTGTPQPVNLAADDLAAGGA
ncbi:hypothetical protein AB0424_28265 [Streptomyces sp. NPDC051180]|uniref:hypothetical protein n=1 Tax=Streptomyces sp. NPDC051180 TaxID=3155797 RepID=UPI00344CBC2A